jgi:hypothetical protein
MVASIRPTDGVRAYQAQQVVAKSESQSDDGTQEQSQTDGEQPAVVVEISDEARQAAKEGQE